MTIAERKTKRNYLLWALLAVVILFIIARRKNTMVRDQSPPPPNPKPLTTWDVVENIAFGLILTIIVALLIMIAPIIPFIAPWIIYMIAGGIAVYALYMTILRHGRSSSVLPDHEPHEMYQYEGGTSILTGAPWKN